MKRRPSKYYEYIKYATYLGMNNYDEIAISGAVDHEAVYHEAVYHDLQPIFY